MAYDLFFLSYNEPSAEENWDKLKKRFPHAKRINGIDGILNAHQTCAKRCLTSHFFVVDADNELLPDFNASLTVAPHDAHYVHLWYARNPVNNLEYGWGGLKLFPRKQVLAANSMGLDMTTGFDLKIIPQVLSVTHFNATPFDAWRSGFREGAKLTASQFKNQNVEENKLRLHAWMNVGEHELNGKEAIRGAMMGNAYAENNKNLENINDWQWLRRVFEETP